MAINNWITDDKKTRTITAVFRPRRGLEKKLLNAIDSAEKRDPCTGYHIVEVPNEWLRTTRRRYFNPDDLMNEYGKVTEDDTGTTRYVVGDCFEYFVRIPLTTEGASANLVEALQRPDDENKRVGLKFDEKLLENPELLKLDNAIQVQKFKEHFLTISRYPSRPDILEISLAKETTTEVTFKSRVEIVNQYVNRIFRALDRKGLVRYE